MKNIKDYQKLIDEGEIESDSLLDICLSKRDPDINAFISICERKVGKESGGSGKLRNIPIAIKDNINVKDIPTTCGSKILEDFIPPYSATVVERIESEGGLIVGKTNLDEFAMGSSTENSYFGVTKNPFDRERVPGGSSGGSAASVAEGSSIIALGSDTGGSVRQPASFCGLVGLKPTYGRVSRYGLVAFASSLDQIGVIGRNAYDVGLMLEVIAGRDIMDSTSSGKTVDNYTDFSISMTDVKIGIPEEYFQDIDAEVKKSVMKVRDALESEGASIHSVSLPSTDYVIPTYQVISFAEASSNLARYDGIRYGLSETGSDFLDSVRKTRNKGFLSEVKRRILIGTFVLSSEAIGEYYEKAREVRGVISREIERALESVDYLLTPVTPNPAFKIGERKDDPLKMHLSDRLTAAPNLCGIPAVSAPCGKTPKGLPLGYQIMGRPFDERGILSVVRRVEKLLPFSGTEEIYG